MRLPWLWILSSSVAFITVLTEVFLLMLLPGSSVLHLTLASHHTLAALLVTTLRAVLFGGVPGVPHWLIVQPIRPR